MDDVVTQTAVPSGWDARSTFRIGYPTRSLRTSPRRPIEAVMMASTTSSRLPFSALPTISSDSPEEQTSAVSTS
jgi:hypothetical protein